MFVFRAANFEDDLLAFPWMLLILLCVIWPLDRNSNIKRDWGGRLQSDGIVPLVVLLALMWKGWFIFVGLLIALYLPRRWSLALSAVVALGALAYFTPWSTGVSENSFGFGSLVFGCFPAIPGLVGILLGKVKVPEWLFKWLAFTVPLGLLVTRFVVFAAFPLAILFVLSWDRFKGNAAFPVFLVVGLLLGPLAILEGPPDPTLMDCLSRFRDKEVSVSWDLVYWAEWSGAVPVSRGDVKPFLTIRNWRENCNKELVEVWAYQPFEVAVNEKEVKR
jgi:hypothetical protein